MSFIKNLGEQAASAGIGAGMGILLGEYNDHRQLRQQQKLQELQIEGQKRMTDYTYAKQLQMWHDTNYEAQMEHIKNAGLNPGLMYGMGGGGGTTTGSGSGSVAGANAPTGGREIQDLTGMGMQMQMMQAQKELLQSQTEKNEAEAAKIKGVDTQEGVQRMEESKTRIDALLQGIDNAKQQNTIQKLEITLKNMENYEKQASQEDRLDYIEYQTKIAAKQLKLITNEGQISDATMADKIKIVGQEAIGSVLRNILTGETTKKTIADTDVARQRVKEIANGIMRDWDKMSFSERETRVKEALKDWTTDPNREALNQAMNSLQSIMHTLKKGTSINNFYE